MSEAVTDTIRSLTGLMLDETRLLASRRRGDLGDLVGAKLRLTARLETQIAALERDDPDWQQQLTGPDREGFARAIEEMQQAATENGQRLLQQIELSRELMEAIVDETRRLDGNQSRTYGAGGGLHRFELPAPIAINERL